jgi:hypothetical protein
MSLLRDLILTAGDALRLSNDLMRYKLEAQARAVKSTVRRVGLFVTLAVVAALLAGTGVGFILYGIFILVARQTGVVAAGLLIGFGLLLLAAIVLLVGRSMASRPVR